MSDYNLLMFHVVGLQDRADFEAIGTLISKRHPGIASYIYSISLSETDLWHVENTDVGVSPVTLAIDKTAGNWGEIESRPLLSFSPVPLQLQTPVRGHKLFAMHSPKDEEIRTLAAAGFDVPRTMPLASGVQLDEEVWGPFIVLKPAAGRGGRGIRLIRTRDIPNYMARHHREGRPPMLAQQWIDTGPFIKSYRALTVLDKVIYIYQSKVLSPVVIDESLVGPEGVNISSNGQPRVLILENNEQVHSMAQAICKAVTFSPTLGIDIIVEAATNRPYAIELNSGFPTWHLSSRYIHHFERVSGYFKREALYMQYNALEEIAESLARKVVELAQ